MLNIIILILKIIGIVIAAVLGLALFVLLLVLFVPMRYRIKAVKDDTIRVDGKASWLFGIILFKIKYTGEKPKYALRICGYKLFSDEPKKAKRKKRKPDVKRSRSHKEKSLPEKVSEPREVVVAQKDFVEKKSCEQVDIKEVTEEKAPKLKKDKEKTNRIASFFNKFKSIKQKIRDMLKTIKGIFRKVGLVKTFVFDYKNRPGFRVVYREIRNFIKHAKPTKFTARVHFGMDDPCYTGQILGAICAIYPDALHKFTLIPDFEHEVLEGDLDARGRIRTVTMLTIIIRVIKDKECKRVWNEWKRLKEEL